MTRVDGSIMQINMPQLGESVTEGTIVNWLKQPGDSVAKYEPICEVATDKVNAEVPATVAGTMREIIVSEGETVSVGEAICTMVVASSEPQESNQVEEMPKTERPEEYDLQDEKRPSSARYSPAVLRLAEENDIDIRSISGSGRDGRVTRKDVMAAISNKQNGIFKPTLPPEGMRQESVIKPFKPQPEVAWSSVLGSGELGFGDAELPFTPLRQTIARRMSESKSEVPHAWTMIEADVTGLAVLRSKLKQQFQESEGINLTFMPFFIKSVAESLKKFPVLNTVWANDKAIVKKKINISVAIAKDDALYVPVLHDADDKSILGLAKALSNLINKVSSQTLKLEDSQGGTFTVNNTGSFGSILSYPIINRPQVAILSLEKIVKKPVVIDDMIAIRSMVNICLSFDHRVLDGYMAGMFLQNLKQKLESYTSESMVSL